MRPELFILLMGLCPLDFVQKVESEKGFSQPSNKDFIPTGNGRGNSEKGEAEKKDKR